MAEAKDDPYDAAVQAVVARFEARLSGGERKWAAQPSLELSETLDPAGGGCRASWPQASGRACTRRRSSLASCRRFKPKARARKKGGSRHAADAKVEDEDDDEEAPLPEVVRLEDQPKCISGRMRDYQARARCLARSSAARRPHLAAHAQPDARARPAGAREEGSSRRGCTASGRVA
jgi:hypothetical protein